MPIYEYHCRQCDSKFEKLVRSMSSSTATDRPVECPDCGGTQTARALSVFAVSGEGSTGAAAPAPTGGCGRCGGPGPCGMN